LIEEYGVIRELRAHVSGIEEEILKGDFRELADYKYHCGLVCGIHYAMQVIEDKARESEEKE
jgi:hypothetical protein